MADIGSGCETCCGNDKPVEFPAEEEEGCSGDHDEDRLQIAETGNDPGELFEAGA